MGLGPEVIHFAPPIIDRGGYSITPADLDFLGLSTDEATAMKECALPLGMTASVYDEFVYSLLGAIHDEGAADADVRIQGSSVKFFSGTHKSMPWERDDIEDEYLRANGQVSPPSRHSLEQIANALGEQWPDANNRPVARPFDVLYRAGLHFVASDYDIQISSAHLVDKIREQIRRRGVDPTDLRVHRPTYNFVRKEYSSELAYLAQWSARACELVGRPVTVAVFDGDGPPDVREEYGDLSSHYKDDDWVLLTPTRAS